MEFEFIDENEIEAVKRGRKTTVPAELVDMFRQLAKLPAGKAVKLTAYTLDAKSEDYKKDKGSISSTIRQAGKLAGVEVRIQWSSQGVPQAKVITPKPKAKAGK